MRSFVSAIIILFGLLFLSVGAYSQCVINGNFNNYEANGMSSTIQWQNLSSTSVICYSSDWQPSFFVNKDSLLNVRITGEMFVNSNSGDDDFIGFVFGYKSPTISTAANDNHFYLFDWKKVGQHAPDEYGGFLAKEGFSLIKTDGIIPSDPVSTYQYFWGHELGENFVPLGEKYGNNLGWEYNTNYFFELLYTYNKIIIRINGEEIFNVDGCYKPGLFGLYTFNQNGAIFRDINIEQLYEISFSSDQEEFCEEFPVNFSFIDTACTYVPTSLASYEWNFGDGSSEDFDLLPTHTFYDPGPYDIELRVTNTEGCTDTISKFLFVEPKPQIIEHPEDQVCFVGDQVTFTINAAYEETYQWYYQSKDMDYWSRVQNNGYFSGATSSQLSVYNVRPNFDQMKLRCVVNGKCFNLVTSQFGQILISDIPVRAYVNPIDNEICTYDSTISVLTIQEPFQIDKANIRILYNENDFEFTGYTTYLQNMIFEVSSDSNYIDVFINVLDPVNLDEAIFASFNFRSIGFQNKTSQFSWDPEYTWFIDENNDTILNYLYNSSIQLNHPVGSNLNDSIHICQGESLTINNDSIIDVIWNTGETSHTIIPNDEGLYTVHLLDINQCESDDSFHIEIDKQPEAPLSIDLSKTFYCDFDDSIQLNVQGGFGTYLNYYQNNYLVMDSVFENSEFSLQNPGENFDIAASWINICGESEKAIETVIVKPESIPFIELVSDYSDLELGDLVTINAHITDGGVSPNLLWYINNQLVQIGSKTTYSTNDLGENQDIYVVLNSKADCILGATSVYDVLNIQLKSTDEYYIPSIITPDGDGVNDVFKVFFKKNDIEDFKLNIYDIRGRLLYTTNNFESEYQGSRTQTNGGIEVLTYFISYKFSDSEEKSITGKFLLKK